MCWIRQSIPAPISFLLGCIELDGTADFEKKILSDRVDGWFSNQCEPEPLNELYQDPMPIPVSSDFKIRCCIG